MSFITTDISAATLALNNAHISAVSKREPLGDFVEDLELAPSSSPKKIKMEGETVDVDMKPTPSQIQEAEAELNKVVNQLFSGSTEGLTDVQKIQEMIDVGQFDGQENTLIMERYLNVKEKPWNSYYFSIYNLATSCIFEVMRLLDLKGLSYTSRRFLTERKSQLSFFIDWIRIQSGKEHWFSSEDFENLNEDI